MIAFSYVVFVIYVFLISSASSEDILKSQYPLYGLAEVAAKNSSTIRTPCNKQLKNLYHAIKKHETWGLKMLDSSGSPANGFIWGNNYWLGRYSQCRWISSKQPFLLKTSATQPSSEFPPFGADFYVGSFKHDSPLQIRLNVHQEDLILLGLCLPSICTKEDLIPLLKSWTNRNPLAIQSVYNFTMKVQSIRLIKEGMEWICNPVIILLLSIMALSLLLTLLGTMYDVCVWSNYLRQEKYNSIEQTPDKDNTWIAVNRNIQESTELLNQDNNLNDNVEFKIDNSMHKSIPIPTVRKAPTAERRKPKEPKFVEKLLVCFSALKNTKSIVKVGESSRDVPEIHGFRFFGMIWIIWLHSIYYLKDYADNKSLALRFSEGFSEQLISNSTFSIDTFFFLNGLIIAVTFYKNRRGIQRENVNFSIKQNVNDLGYTILKRFIRLTPVYLIVLGLFNVINIRNKQTSLFYKSEYSNEMCEKYWWRNLLYVNNLFRGSEMCMSWSWYLSTEMQFFVIGAVILMLSVRFWRFAASLAGSLILISSLITAYLSYSSGYVPTLDQQMSMMDILYYPPWTRIGPYLVGLITGYFVIHLNGTLFIKKMTLITCWVMGLLCNLWALFGLFKRDMSVISSALYTSLSRTAWGIGLSWIIIACSTNNAGLVKKFLSFKGWIPFSKLSFMAYILSPLIINLIYSSAETAIHMDFFPMVVYFFGYVGITYFSAYFFALLLEKPIKRISKLCIGSKQTINVLSQNS